MILFMYWENGGKNAPNAQAPQKNAKKRKEKKSDFDFTHTQKKEHTNPYKNGERGGEEGSSEEEEDEDDFCSNGARLISRPLAGEKRQQVEERPEQREQGNRFDAAAESGERRASDAGEEGEERGAKSEGFSNREIDDGTGEGRRGEEGESERKTKDEPVREQQSAPGETAEVDCSLVVLLKRVVVVVVVAPLKARSSFN